MFGFEIESWNVGNWHYDYANVYEYQSYPADRLIDIIYELRTCYYEHFPSISRLENEDEYVGMHIHFTKGNDVPDYNTYARLYNILFSIHPLFYNSYSEDTYSKRILSNHWCRISKHNENEYNEILYVNEDNRHNSILTLNMRGKRTLEFRLPDVPYSSDVISLVYNIYEQYVKKNRKINPNKLWLYQEKYIKSPDDVIKIIPSRFIPLTFSIDEIKFADIVTRYLKKVIGYKMKVIRDGQVKYRKTENIIQNMLKIQRTNYMKYRMRQANLEEIGFDNRGRILKELGV